MQSADASTGNTSRSRRATVTPGPWPSSPLWRSSTDRFSPMEYLCTCPHLSDGGQGHCKTSKSQNMKAREANRRARWRFPHPSSRPIVCPLGGGKSGTVKWGPREDRGVLGGSRGSKARTWSLGSYCAHPPDCF